MPVSARKRGLTTHQDNIFSTKGPAVKYLLDGVQYSDQEHLLAAVRGIPQKGKLPDSLTWQQLALPQNEARLAKEIKQLFFAYAGANRTLELSEMTGLAQVLAAKLDIPMDAFGDINMLFWRYDFSGDSKLDLEEGTMLIQGMIRTYRDQTCDTPISGLEDNVIRYKTLTQDYEIEKKIGQGGQGAIYLAKSKKDKQVKVVKYYDKSSANAPLDDIIAEFKLLTGLDHPKIARTFEIFQDAANIYVVNEPYFGGDLEGLLSKADQAGVTVSYCWLAEVLKQVCDGVSFLHSNHVMHCDLKEPNVMLSGSDYARPNVVVIDFGLAQNFSGGAMDCGTPGYIPPEVWEYGMWTPKGDTFSLGVMFFQIITWGNRSPFCENAQTIEDIRDNTLICQLPEPSPLTDPAYRRLVYKMLAPNFHDRPPVKNLTQDSWFVEALASGGANVSKGALQNLVKVKRKDALHQALLVDMASTQNLAQMRELQDLFIHMDTDNSGSVSADEVRKGLKGKLAAKVLEKFISELSLDNGEIPYTQFMAHMISVGKANSRQEIWEIFQNADTDGSNFLEIGELEKLLRKPAVAAAMGDRTASDLFKQMDPRGTGKVSFNDFANTLMPKQPSEGSEEQPLRVGMKVEYFSVTQNTWISCTVVNVSHNGIQIDAKPGAWLRGSELGKIRMPHRPGKQPGGALMAAVKCCSWCS